MHPKWKNNKEMNLGVFEFLVMVVTIAGNGHLTELSVFSEQ